MSNQPGDKPSGQNNMSAPNDGTYYNNSMQGSAAQPVQSYQNKFGDTTFGYGSFFAPGLESQGTNYQGTFFSAPQGDMFARNQSMLQQAYDPNMVQNQRDLMLQSARQANLMGLQSTQGQLSQMGLGTLGGQAGALSGQYAQGAMAEEQARQAGQQMAQMAAQGQLQAQQQQLAMETGVGDAIAQSYGSAYDVVTQTAPEGFMISEALEADLAQYANLLGQQVLSGQMSIAEMQMLMTTYADKWSQSTGLPKYMKVGLGRERQTDVGTPVKGNVQRDLEALYGPGGEFDQGTYFTVSSQSGTQESE
tara:strand:- start:276 stop:1193 length:918 start_codon:yes stop_codon:yes gene_type:complete